MMLNLPDYNHNILYNHRQFLYMTQSTCERRVANKKS